MNKQSKYIAIGIGIVVAGGLVYLVVKRTGVLKNTGASYTGAPQNVGINPNQGPLSNPGSAGGTSSLIGKAIYTNRNDVVIRSSPTIDDGWLFNNVGYSVPAAGTWIGAVTEIDDDKDDSQVNPATNKVYKWYRYTVGPIDDLYAREDMVNVK